MKKLNIIFSVLVVGALILGLILPLVSNAQTGRGPTGPVNPPPANQNYQIRIPNPLRNGQNDLPGLLNWIIDQAVLPIGGIIAALMIMYAGFMYVTARGDTTKIKNAHNALLYAAIGAGVLLGAKVIATAIQGTVNQIGG